MRTVTPLALLLLAACPADTGTTDSTGPDPTGSSSGTTDAPTTGSTDPGTSTTGEPTTEASTEPTTVTTTAPTTEPTTDPSTDATTDPTTGDTDATTTDATTGTTGEPAMLPGDILDLTNWKLTLPVDTDHPGSPDEIEQPELADFVDPLYYHLNETLDAVVFRAHTGGDTTENSGYPRSELREMIDDGAEEAAWSSSEGKHRMDIDQKITHLPVVKPHIVVGQIHDGNSDVLVFRLEDTKLFIDINGEDGPVLEPDYQLGTRFTVAFEVSGDHVDCYYNGELVYTHEEVFDEAYFKAGAYVQSSCQGEKQVDGEECDAYGEVEIYAVAVSHE